MITSEDVEKRGKPTALPMSQGDILFFSNLTFHSSKPNITDKVMWSVDLRYVVPPLDVTLTEQQQGYIALNTHYGVTPITVRSRRKENVASLAQLQEFVARYSAQKTTPGKSTILSDPLRG
ncbi:MAG: phytanoyl-CoA dioxygenase family protein [Candidatus Latescibacterota bacterium]|nr:phytanoyl-CoA dioxygenase family protein [Candidatus Latescibacterota bacterium]